MPVLGPEARVLLSTAPLELEDASTELFCDPALDWPLLLNLTVLEGAQPVFSQRLSPEIEAAAPAEVVASLREHARFSGLRMLTFQQRLMQAAKALAKQGIDVLLLKGAGLALSAYRSFAARPMSDADLMVRSADAMRAWDHLRAHGWRSRDGESASLYDEMHHLPPLTIPDGLRLSIEIHTHLFPPSNNPFNFPPEDLWTSARPMQLGDARVYVPGELHQMLHLCVHYAWSHMLKHGSWRTFRDVHVLTRTGTFEWAPFISEAQRRRIASSSYWTLRLARSLTGARVPEDVLKALSPGWPEPVLSRLERHFATEMFIHTRVCPSFRLRRVAWELGIRPRREGYGASRPWSLDWDDPDTQELSASLPQPGRSAGAWLHYVRTILAL